MYFSMCLVGFFVRLFLKTPQSQDLGLASTTGVRGSYTSMTLCHTTESRLITESTTRKAPALPGTPKHAVFLCSLT